MSVVFRSYKPKTKRQQLTEWYAARYETTPPCSLCWWYRGVLSHSLFSVVSGFLLGLAL